MWPRTKIKKFQVRNQTVSLNDLMASRRFFIAILQRSAEHEDCSDERIAPIEQ